MNNSMKLIWCTLAMVVAMQCFAESPPSAKTFRQVMKPGVGYANVPTTEALTLEDVDRWATMLNASEPQREFMRLQYKSFVSAYNEAFDREAPKLLEISADVAQRQGDQGLASTVDDMRRLNSAIRRYRSQVEQVESDYIDSIMPVLTDSQVDRLFLLRIEASKRQVQLEFCVQRWTGVKLRAVWDEVCTVIVEPSDLETMDLILAEYEVRLTNLLRRAADNRAWAGVEMATLLAQVRHGDIASESFRESYQALWNRIGDAEKRIRELTEQTVKTAGEVLSPQVGARFIAEAKAAAFPELYPDVTSLHELLQNLAASKTLDDSAKEAAASMQMVYINEYSAVNEELEEFCVHWGDQASRGVNGYQHQFLTGAMKPLLTKRAELSAKHAARLIEILGSEIVAAHRPTPRTITRTPGQIRAASVPHLNPVILPDAAYEEIPRPTPDQ